MPSRAYANSSEEHHPGREYLLYFLFSVVFVWIFLLDLGTEGQYRQLASVSAAFQDCNVHAGEPDDVVSWGDVQSSTEVFSWVAYCVLPTIRSGVAASYNGIVGGRLSVDKFAYGLNEQSDSKSFIAVVQNQAGGTDQFATPTETTATEQTGTTASFSFSALGRSEEAGEVDDKEDTGQKSFPSSSSSSFSVFGSDKETKRGLQDSGTTTETAAASVTVVYFRPQDFSGNVVGLQTAVSDGWFALPGSNLRFEVLLYNGNLDKFALMVYTFTGSGAGFVEKGRDRWSISAVQWNDGGTVFLRSIYLMFVIWYAFVEVQAILQLRRWLHGDLGEAFSTYFQERLLPFLIVVMHFVYAGLLGAISSSLSATKIPAVSVLSTATDDTLAGYFTNVKNATMAFDVFEIWGSVLVVFMAIRVLSFLKDFHASFGLVVRTLNSAFPLVEGVTFTAAIIVSGIATGMFFLLGSSEASFGEWPDAWGETYRFLFDPPGFDDLAASDFPFTSTFVMGIAALCYFFGVVPVFVAVVVAAYEEEREDLQDEETEEAIMKGIAELRDVAVCGCSQEVDEKGDPNEALIAKEKKEEKTTVQGMKRDRLRRQIRIPFAVFFFCVTVFFYVSSILQINVEDQLTAFNHSKRLAAQSFSSASPVQITNSSSGLKTLNEFTATDTSTQSGTVSTASASSISSSPSSSFFTARLESLSPSPPEAAAPSSHSNRHRRVLSPKETPGQKGSEARPGDSKMIERAERRIKEARKRKERKRCASRGRGRSTKCFDETKKGRRRQRSKAGGASDFSATPDMNRDSRRLQEVNVEESGLTTSSEWDGYLNGDSGTDVVEREIEFSEAQTLDGLWDWINQTVVMKMLQVTAGTHELFLSNPPVRLRVWRDGIASNGNGVTSEFQPKVRNDEVIEEDTASTSAFDLSPFGTNGTDFSPDTSTGYTDAFIELGTQTAMKAQVASLKSLNLLDYQTASVQVAWTAFDGDGLSVQTTTATFRVDPAGGINSQIQSAAMNLEEKGSISEVSYSLGVTAFTLIGLYLVCLVSLGTLRLIPFDGWIAVDAGVLAAATAAAFTWTRLVLITVDPSWLQTEYPSGDPPGSPTRDLVPGPDRWYAYTVGKTETPHANAPSSDRAGRIMDGFAQMITYRRDFARAAGTTMILLAVRLVKYADVLPQTGMIVRVLRKARVRLMVLFGTVWLFFGAFIVLSHVALGARHEAFKTLIVSAISCLRMATGFILDFSEWDQPEAASAFTVLFTVLVFFVANNVVIAVLVESTDEVQREYAEEEEEAEREREVQRRKQQEELHDVESLLSVEMPVGIKVNDRILLFTRAVITAVKMRSVDHERNFEYEFSQKMNSFLEGMKIAVGLKEPEKDPEEQIGKRKCCQGCCGPEEEEPEDLGPVLVPARVRALLQAVCDGVMLTGRLRLLMKHHETSKEEIRKVYEKLKERQEYLEAVELSVSRVSKEVSALQDGIDFLRLKGTGMLAGKLGAQRDLPSQWQQRNEKVEVDEEEDEKRRKRKEFYKQMEERRRQKWEALEEEKRKIESGEAEEAGDVVKDYWKELDAQARVETDDKAPAVTPFRLDVEDDMKLARHAQRKRAAMLGNDKKKEEKALKGADWGGGQGSSSSDDGNDYDWNAARDRYGGEFGGRDVVAYEAKKDAHLKQEDFEKRRKFVNEEDEEMLSVKDGERVDEDSNLGSEDRPGAGMTSARKRASGSGKEKERGRAPSLGAASAVSDTQGPMQRAAVGRAAADSSDDSFDD